MLEYFPEPQSRSQRAVRASDTPVTRREMQPASRGRTPSTKEPSTEEPLTEEARREEAKEQALARQMCVVEFRSGEAVIRHPDLRCLLDAGWLIESAVPQLAESEEVELRVVLSKGGGLQSMSADEDL